MILLNMYQEVMGMKSVVKGIEIMSNRNEEGHRRLCDTIKEYIDIIFEGVTEGEILNWIKLIDFTVESIGNNDEFKGCYYLDKRIINIVDKDQFNVDVSLYHEIVHGRIYYENRAKLKYRTTYWELINEYKTIVKSCSYFMNRFIEEGNDEKKKLVFNVILDKIFNNIEKVMKYHDSETGNLSDENREYDIWYPLANACGGLFLLDKYNDKYNDECDGEKIRNSNDIFKVFRDLPYVKPVLEKCNLEYKISNLEENYLASCFRL